MVTSRKRERNSSRPPRRLDPKDFKFGSVYRAFCVIQWPRVTNGDDDGPLGSVTEIQSSTHTTRPNKTSNLLLFTALCSFSKCPIVTNGDEDGPLGNVNEIQSSTHTTRPMWLQMASFSRAFVGLPWPRVTNDDDGHDSRFCRWQNPLFSTSYLRVFIHQERKHICLQQNFLGQMTWSISQLFGCRFFPLPLFRSEPLSNQSPTVSYCKDEQEEGNVRG